jgi:hypothetical protein
MSETDDEVGAWTETFVNYFLPTYMNREGWLPLIGYYEGASAGARTTACNAIVAFANRLPTTAAAGGGRGDRDKLDTWLRRRTARLGDRVEAADRRPERTARNHGEPAVIAAAVRVWVPETRSRCFASLSSDRFRLNCLAGRGRGRWL